jgi:hypothetical protein
MTGDEYLQKILAREAIDNTTNSPVFQAAQILYPVIRQWAGSVLSNIQPSGSYAKGTANRNGTDIDLFVSISENCSNTLKELYDGLFNHMTSVGYNPKKQNVSINVRVKSSGGGEYDVDLVPGKRQNSFSQDHSLWVSRASTWKQTNIQTHITTVQSAGRQAETRIIKLWRHQKRIEFPSFIIELAVIAALQGKTGSLAANVMDVFRWLSNNIASTRLFDPANTNNIVSDTMTVAEKTAVKNAADTVLKAATWGNIVT